MGMAVRPQADVDRNRHLELVRHRQQIIDRVGDSGRIGKSFPPLIVVIRQRNQHRRNRRFAADAVIAGGNAGHVRAMRADGHLRLLFDFEGGQAEFLRCGDGLIEMLLAKLRAKIKLVAKPLFVLPVRRRAGVAPLVPDANEAGFFAAEKIRVRKIESLHVNDAYQDPLAILMALR